MNIEHFLKTNKKLPLSLKVTLNILVLAAKLKRGLNDFLKSYSITEPQFNVLRILRGQNGKPANLKQVQERMVHLTSNTTRLIDKLVMKGLVTRIIPQENRRKIELTITKKGLDLLEEMDPEFDRFIDQLIANIDPEETHQLNSLLEKAGDWK